MIDGAAGRVHLGEILRLEALSRCQMGDLSKVSEGFACGPKPQRTSRLSSGAYVKETFMGTLSGDLACCNNDYDNTSCRGHISY